MVMKDFSIIVPCEKSRLPMFISTLQKYKAITKNFHEFNVEFILTSRSLTSSDIKELETVHNTTIRVINYSWNEPSFNPAMALNLGVHNAQYGNIVVTCPEIEPQTDVLNQFSLLKRGNYIAKVFDTFADGTLSQPLVAEHHWRNVSPAMYFLALFKKEDLYLINGWDEDFMLGYCFEDDDFGSRFNRAGLSFKIKDDIVAIHKWHVRASDNANGMWKQEWEHNKTLFMNNNHNRVIRPKNGLVKE